MHSAKTEDDGIMSAGDIAPCKGSMYFLWRASWENMRYLPEDNLVLIKEDVFSPEPCSSDINHERLEINKEAKESQHENRTGI